MYDKKDLKILYLTLKEEHFKDILTGKKKIEYRWYKPYWVKRLENKEFDVVHFTNGYGGNRPSIRLWWKETRIITGSSPIGTGKQFAIVLGDLLECWNCDEYGFY